MAGPTFYSQMIRSALIRFVIHTGPKHSLSIPSRYQNSGHFTIKKWLHPVAPFGSLNVTSVWPITIVPLIAPDDLGLAQIILKAQNCDNSAFGSCQSKVSNNQIDCLFGASDSKTFTASLHIKLPPQFNINVESKGSAEVNILQMENDEIIVKSENGATILAKIKCRQVNISSDSGDIIVKSVLRGDAVFSTKCKGRIIMDRIQGNVLQCENQMGSIKTKAVYVDKSEFTSHGSLILQNVHGKEADISSVCGDVIVSNLDVDQCSIQSTVGHIKLHVARHGRVTVNSDSGDINLSISDIENSSVCCKAGEGVHLHENIPPHLMKSHLPQEIPKFISASSKCGKILLMHQDWLSSLNLKGDKKT